MQQSCCFIRHSRIPHTRVRLDCQILSFPATTWCFHTRLARLGGRHPFPFLALPSWPLASSKNWGSWVVLPDPVSPTSTTVWLRLMSFKNSFLRLGCIHIRPKTKVMIYPILPPFSQNQKSFEPTFPKIWDQACWKNLQNGRPQAPSIEGSGSWLPKLEVFVASLRCRSSLMKSQATISIPCDSFPYQTNGSSCTNRPGASKSCTVFHSMTERVDLNQPTQALIKDQSILSSNRWGSSPRKLMIGVCRMFANYNQQVRTKIPMRWQRYHLQFILWAQGGTNEFCLILRILSIKVRTWQVGCVAVSRRAGCRLSQPIPKEMIYISGWWVFHIHSFLVSFSMGPPMVAYQAYCPHKSSSKVYGCVSQWSSVYAKSQSCIHILCVYTYINKRNIHYMIIIDCNDDCFTLVI